MRIGRSEALKVKLRQHVSRLLRMFRCKKGMCPDEKRIAVELYVRDGLPCSEIARELNIHRTNIKHWESFFGHFKSECFHLHTFESEEQLIQAIEQ
jgi:transposase-like protein